MAEAIYLDNHIRARPSKKAIEEFSSKQTSSWGSLATFHESGQGLTAQKESAEKFIKEALGAKKTDRLLISSGAFESNFSVFFTTYLEWMRENGRMHLLAHSLESRFILQPIKRLEKLGICRKPLLMNSYGQLTKELLEEQLRPKVAMLSISWADGLTGVIQPIWDIAELCKEKDVLLHVDASHVIGKLYFHFEDFPIDFLTFDASCFHAPFGIGALLIREDEKKARIEFEENEINFPHLSVLKVSVEEAIKNIDHLSLEAARLKSKFETTLLDHCSNCCVLFQNVERLSHTTVMSFPGICAEALLFEISRQGVYASIGGGNYQMLSHQLQKMGIDKELADSALSFSLSVQTNEKEIDQAAEIVIHCIKKLQKYSTGFKK